LTHKTGRSLNGLAGLPRIVQKPGKQVRQGPEAI
jgi:hypothetical protein